MEGIQKVERVNKEKDNLKAKTLGLSQADMKVSCGLVRMFEMEVFLLLSMDYLYILHK